MPNPDWGQEELGMEEGNLLLRNAIDADNTEGAYICIQ